MESPTFSESLFRQGPTRYTIPKPKLDRAVYDPTQRINPQLNEVRATQGEAQSRVTEVPKVQVQPEAPNPALECMRSLWKRIDRLDDALANPGLTPQQTYHLRKLILELRREQYTIGDFLRPQIQLHSVV